jgi:ABC-type uncharacterized transport system fused permease/ATPase subunit
MFFPFEFLLYWTLHAVLVFIMHQDEATSALDVESEAKMYSLLQNMKRKVLEKHVDDSLQTLSRPGLTFISVGHRPTLLAYHDIKLRLNGGSDYTLEQVERSASIAYDSDIMLRGM